MTRIFIAWCLLIVVGPTATGAEADYGWVTRLDHGTDQALLELDLSGVGAGDRILILSQLNRANATLVNRAELTAGGTKVRLKIHSSQQWRDIARGRVDRFKLVSIVADEPASDREIDEAWLTFLDRDTKYALFEFDLTGVKTDDRILILSQFNRAGVAILNQAEIKAGANRIKLKVFTSKQWVQIARGRVGSFKLVSLEQGCESRFTDERAVDGDETQAAWDAHEAAAAATSDGGWAHASSRFLTTA